MNVAETQFQRAEVLHKSGDLEGAAREYRAVLAAAPECAEAWHQLGLAQFQQGEFAAAAESIRTAIAVRSDADFHCNLGTVLQTAGELAAAREAFEAALDLAAGRAELHFNYANCMKRLNRWTAAEAAYRQALALRPDYPQALNNLGNTLVELDRLDEAVECFRRALRLRSPFPDAAHNLGNTLVRQERHQEAQPHFAAAAKDSAGRPEFLQSYFLSLSYTPGIDPRERFELHRLWGVQVQARHPRPTRFANLPDPHRRLRVGYVSADFREHAVAHFVEPMLQHHDRRGFEVFCYSNVARPDMVTERLRNRVDHWRTINGLSDDAAAAVIRGDGIDLLFDLAGHTAGNRLGIFLRKPAPVQVTGIGYGWTTGIPSMDYRLTDEVLDPPGEPVGYTETLCRVPGGVLCYQPPTDAPAVGPLPALSQGSITFAAFHRHVKLNSDTLAAWSEILQRVTGSRLLLKDRAYRLSHVRERMFSMCLEAGISPERLVISTGEDSRRDHWTAYGQVDVALDTWPYAGSTTTCEALWMGVPVVTLAGGSYVGRLSASLLDQLGGGNLVAATKEEYIDIAVQCATDWQELSRQRESLREQMSSSRLCDGPAYVRELERCYRQMWQHWCGNQVAPRRAS